MENTGRQKGQRCFELFFIDLKLKMGSQLTKNYDVEKDTYMQGGLHCLWRCHRAKKKVASDTADVSIFMFDKKNKSKN